MLLQQGDIQNTGNHRMLFVLSYTIIHGIINLNEDKKLSQSLRRRQQYS